MIVLLNNAVSSIKSRSIKSNPVITREIKTAKSNASLTFDLGHFKKPKEVNIFTDLSFILFEFDQNYFNFA